jgi:hypothetical protein
MAIANFKYFLTRFLQIQYTGMYCKYLFLATIDPSKFDLNKGCLVLTNKGSIFICLHFFCLYLHGLEHGSCWIPPGEYPGC